MLSRVLVAMDDSEMGERTLTHALKAYPESDITVLHVVGGPSSMFGTATGMALSGDVEKEASEEAEAVLARAREIAAEYDVEITTEIDVGHPARSILDRAEAYDTIVIGTHSSTVAERLFVGNVAKRIFHRSPVPVTVVR